MNLKHEDIVRRFSRRTGFDLINYHQVALPIFRVTVRTLMLERKDLPPIPEFILKAIQEGVSTPNNIALLLGLEQRVVDTVLRTLLQSDNILMIAPNGSNTTRLILTPKGIETVEAAKLVMPVEIPFQVDIDGLTRQALDSLGAGLLRPSEVEKDGMEQLPAHPRRKPDFDEVAKEARKHFDNVVKDSTDAQRDLIEILTVERTERFFRTDALMLTFKASGGEEIQVGFVIDERPSEAHEIAFRRLEASSKVRAAAHAQDKLDKPPIIKFEEEIILNAVPSAKIKQLHTEMDQAFRKLAELTEHSQRIHDTASVSEKAALKVKLREEQEKVADLEEKLNEEKSKVKVHKVEVYEHPGYLKRAFDTATHRIMIISPWIKSTVVDNDFFRMLGKALTRGVDVHIGYGLEGESSRESEWDTRAIDRLYKMAEQNSNFHIEWFGDTHAKVLVCDDWHIITSFNWLSFRGDRRMQYRDERGTFVAILENTNEQFDSYLPRFDKKQ